MVMPIYIVHMWVGKGNGFRIHGLIKEGVIFCLNVFFTLVHSSLLSPAVCFLPIVPVPEQLVKIIHTLLWLSCPPCEVQPPSPQFCYLYSTLGVQVTIDDCPVQFHVYKRPHVGFFLNMVTAPLVYTVYGYVRIYVSAYVCPFVGRISV